MEAAHDSSVEDAARGQAQPHMAEAERVMIGALLADNRKIDELPQSALEPHNFYVKSHQIICEHILRLHHTRSVPVDLVTLSESLDAAGMLDIVGGAEYLGDLISAGEYAPNFDNYASIVRDLAALRRLIEETRAIRDSAYERGDNSADAIIDDAERRIFELSSQYRDKRNSSLRPIQEIVRDVHNRIQEMHERQENQQSPYTGLVTGYKCLDDASSGLQPGELTVLAARPSVGKTSFALDIVRNVCTNPDEEGKQRAALFFSLEMSATQLGYRLTSVVSGVDQHSMRIGKLKSASDWASLIKGLHSFDEWPLWIDEATMLTVNDLRSRARQIMRQAESAGHKMGLVVVDYLQLMIGSRQDRTENRTLEVSAISRGLKSLARELQVPVLALSQMSRRIEERTGNRPQLSDLRESGSIEQDADLIVFLARSQPTKDDEPVHGTSRIDLIIGKNRNGPVGLHKLLFNQRQTHFTELGNATEHDFEAANRPYDDPTDHYTS